MPQRLIRNVLKNLERFALAEAKRSLVYLHNISGSLLHLSEKVRTFADEKNNRL